MIQVICNACGKKMWVHETRAGKHDQCACGNKLTIPGIAEAAGEEVFWEFTPLAIGLAVGLLILSGVFLWYAKGLWDAYNLEREAQESFKKGVEAFDAERGEEAWERFEKCMALKPEWTAAALYGAALALKMDKADAEQRLKKLLDAKLEPIQQAFAYSGLAYLALRKKEPDLDKARMYLENALKKDAGFGAAHMMLAIMAWQKGGATADAASHIEAARAAEANLHDSAMPFLRRLRLREVAGNKEKLMEAAAGATGQADLEQEAAILAARLLFREKDIDPQKDEAFINLAAKACAFLPPGQARTALEIRLRQINYRAGRYAEVVADLEKRKIDEKPASDDLLLLANCHAALWEKAQDQAAKEQAGKRAVSLYRALVADDKYAAKQGQTLVYHAINLCDRVGDAEAADWFLERGLAVFPEDAKLHRRRGYRCFQRKDYQKGVEHLEKSLKADPKQDDLAREVANYRKPPVFSDFRPCKPEQYLARPLIHVRVESGTPFPLAFDTVAMKLDGERVQPARGGNELFFVPEKDLAGGKHTVEITAADELGNSASATFTFPVDTSPPLAEMLEPEGASTFDERPLIKLKLFDELTAVAPESVTIIIRSAPGSDSLYTNTPLQKGVYMHTEEDLGYQKGDRLKNPENIQVRPRNALKAGIYEIVATCKDVLGYAAEKRFTLIVKGE